MFVTEVIPLVKNAPVEPLSYYTSQRLALGSVVTLPLRKKSVRALVVDQNEVPLSKLTLKAASFGLRRLPPQEATQSISPTTIELARTLTKRNPYPLGALYTALLPAEILSGVHTQSSTTIPHEDSAYRATLLQDTFTTRLQSHKLTIRETFARRGSVLVMAPTHADAEFLFEALKHGIEKRTLLLTHRSTKRQLAAAYASLDDYSHTKLIVVTPSHLTVARADVLQIIVEHSRSSHYLQKQRPYLNFKDAAQARALVERISLTIADILPHTEDEWLRREGFIEPTDEPAQRLAFSSSVKLIIAPKKARKPFLPLYDKTISTIKDALKEKQHVFIYAARRGLAPLIVCSDCGHIFCCPHSGAPYSLFRTEKNGEEQRWFVSVTGTRIRALDVCTECGSWKLQELGVGVQRIKEQLANAFPDTPLIVFDHTTATTPRKRLQLMAEFREAKQALLLGTAMTLPSLTEPVDSTIVTSLEAIRAHPSWRSEEDALALLLTLRDKTTDMLYLQTKHEADESLVQFTKSGQVEKFYSEEIALREKLHYPPFVIFVHVMFVGKKEKVQEIEIMLKGILSSYEMRFYSNPQSTKDRTVRCGLLRVERSAWPDTQLLALLRTLPPYVRVEINPERLV